MPDYVIVNGELYHHGIKGMKWGVRRYENYDGSLTPAGKKRYISGFEGRRNAAKAVNEARKKSIAESRATDSGVGSLHRANQKAYYASKKAYVESIKKDKAHNKQLRAEKKQAKEDKKTVKTMQKQYGALEDALTYKSKVTEKDMYKAYGRIEDSLTYSKRSNKKANEYAEKALAEIDKQLSQTGKKPTYDLEKVNDFVEQALSAIDDDLASRR